MEGTKKGASWPSGFAFFRGTLARNSSRKLFVSSTVICAGCGGNLLREFSGCIQRQSNNPECEFPLIFSPDWVRHVGTVIIEQILTQQLP